MDNLYYYTPESLYAVIKRYIQEGAPILAVLKPILIQAPGLYAETYKVPLAGSNDTEDNVFKDVVEGQAWATVSTDQSVSTTKIEYFSSTNQIDGVYHHPSPRFWFENVVHAMDPITGAQGVQVHVHRSLPYSTFLRIVYVHHQVMSQSMNHKRQPQGALVDKGVCLKTLPELTIAASKLNPSSQLSSESFFRTCYRLVVRELRAYDDFDWISNVAKCTMERAQELAVTAIPRFTTNTFLEHSVEQNVEETLTEQGFPMVFAGPLSILSVPSRTRLGAGVKMLRAGGKLVSGVLSAASTKMSEFRVNPMSVAGSPGIQKWVARTEGALGRWLHHHHKKSFMEVSARIMQWCAANPEAASVLDGVSLFIESMCEAAVEEAFKRSLRLVGVDRTWTVFFGTLFGLLEGLLYATAEDQPVPFILVTIFHMLGHALLMLIPYPIAVLIHGLTNFVARYNDGSRFSSFVKSIYEAVMKEITEEGMEPLITGEVQPIVTTCIKAYNEMGEELNLADLEAVLPYAYGSSRRLCMFDSDLNTSLGRPMGGARSLLNMANLRLDVERAIPTEGFWDNQLVSVFSDICEWKFEPLDEEEVREYIKHHPVWPASWRTHRLAQFDACMDGAGDDDQGLFVKTDELLKFRGAVTVGDDDKLHGPQKVRPIFGATGSAMIDYHWQPRFKMAAKTPLTFDGQVPIEFHYVVSPNAEVLTTLFAERDPFVLTIYVHGDDMVLFYHDWSVAIDLVTCDINNGDEFQRWFASTILRLGGDGAPLREIMKAHVKRLTNTVVIHPRDLKGTEVHFEYRPVEASTLTGEPATAVKAACSWVVVVSNVARVLKHLNLTPAAYLQATVSAFKRVMHDGGFVPKFETYKGAPIMPLECATFLGGTFVRSGGRHVWVPLKMVKAMFIPEGVFGNSNIAQAVGWARVCLRDEIAILPIRYVYQNIVDQYPTTAENALVRWEHYRLQHKVYNSAASAVKCSYEITWQEWEDQLSLLTSKYGGDQTLVGPLLAELSGYSEGRVVFPLPLLSSAVPLFLARFGEIPVGVNDG
jgi:hypothetical protein